MTDPAARRPRVTLDQLHTFTAVARREHVTRAAEALHLTQGAVSQQLRTLERALGLVLLERTGRRVRLTDAGRRVATAAQPVLQAARAVEEVADAVRGLQAGSVSVVATGVMGVHRLPTWLAAFVDAHPDIDVSLRLANTADALAALGDGSADCAVVGGAVPRTGVEAIVLERDQLVAVAAADHPLTRHVPSATELARHRYLARERGSATELLAPRVLGTAYRSGPVLELGRLEAVRAAVVAGLGYAVLPYGVIADDVSAGRVAVIPRRGRPVEQVFQAVRRRGPHTPAAGALWDHLRAVAGTEPGPPLGP